MEIHTVFDIKQLFARFTCLKPCHRIVFLLSLILSGCVVPSRWIDSPSSLKKEFTQLPPPVAVNPSDEVTTPVESEVEASQPQKEHEPEPKQTTDRVGATDRLNSSEVVPSSSLSYAELTAVYSNLKKIREIDSERHDQLKTKLKSTDQESWPKLVQTVRDSLSEHERKKVLKAAPADHSRQLTEVGEIDNEKTIEQDSVEPSSQEPDNPLRKKAEVSYSKLQSIATGVRDVGLGSTDPLKGRKWLVARQSDEADTVPVQKIVKPMATQQKLRPTLESVVDPQRLQQQGRRVVEAIMGESVLVSENSKLNSQGWQHALSQAIESLEKETGKKDISQAEEARKQALLRLLYLIAGRSKDAIEPVTGFKDLPEQFWPHQLHGMAIYLADGEIPVMDRRAALALREFRTAAAELAEVSRLDVRNLAFCSEVESYGRYVKFEPNRFEPNQQVLLYVEIDNFTVEETTDGFATAFKGNYQILDFSGNRVADQTFQLEQETCRNRRRDYFIPYRMWMPKEIQPGSYTLQLTIEDVKGHKFGQSSIDFEIR